MSPPHAVTLYTRAGCHLCEDAEAVLRAAQATSPFELALVDVDADPALADRYGLRVPVVAVDGVERFEFEVPRAELLAALGAAPATASAAAPAAPDARSVTGRDAKRRFWRW